MKDAKGHGSNPRGGAAHASGVEQVGKPVPVSPRAIRIITRQAGTGFSVAPNGKVPTTGFQVAVQGRTEPQPLDLNDIAGHVAAHVAKNADIYRDPRYFIGGWNSPYTGKVHLEPSQNVSNRAVAVGLGKARNQVSIWNNAKGEDIPTGGTGQ